MKMLYKGYRLLQSDGDDLLDFMMRWLAHLLNEAQREFETATPQEMLGFIVIALLIITSLLAVGFKGVLRGSGGSGGDFGDGGSDGGGDGGGGDGGGG
jgi:uncharacterized membrane protein YgcG